MAATLKELFYSRSTDELDYLRRAGCQFAVYSARAPYKEKSNEDCAGWVRLDRDRWVFIVADGLGGLPAGDSASQLAVSVLLDRLANLGEKEEARHAILAGIDMANNAILDTGSGGATTLVVVEFDAGMVRPYHVGDSTILIAGQRGRVKFQTVSHSPTGYLEESGLIDERGAMLHEDRHLVSNVVGSDAMRLEIGPTFQLAKYDTVLMATDGLSDNLTQEQAVELIRTGHLEKSLGKLAVSCRRMMINQDSDHAHPDDLTMVAIRRT